MEIISLNANLLLCICDYVYLFSRTKKIVWMFTSSSFAFALLESDIRRVVGRTYCMFLKKRKVLNENDERKTNRQIETLSWELFFIILYRSKSFFQIIFFYKPMSSCRWTPLGLSKVVFKTHYWTVLRMVLI